MTLSYEIILSIFDSIDLVKLILIVVEIQSQFLDLLLIVVIEENQVSYKM